MEEIEEEVKVELEPEGTDLQPVAETADAGITLESVHAMLLELQGTVQNLQAAQDQAIPVEPNAEEVPEDTPADDSALLEEGTEDTAAAPEEDVEELDKLLSGN